MRGSRLLFASVLALALGASARLEAAPRPWPLQPIPAERLTSLLPSLSGQDLVLVETDGRAVLKQITTVTLVAAPPQAVHDVVAHPERYSQFIHNMSRSEVRSEPGGSLVHNYKLDYTVTSVDGRHRYRFLPAVAGQGAPPIDVSDPDDNGTRHYVWEFYGAPGDQTLLVVYGYSQIPNDGLYAKLIRCAQTLEYGLALIPQMTLLLAVKERAERTAGVLPVRVGGPAPRLDYFLERGTLALFRRAGGRVSELSLVDRTRARADVLARVAGNVSEWSRFVPTIVKSRATASRQGMSAVEIEQSLPLMNWTTVCGVLASSSAVDMVGLEGDLLHARMRWDVRAVPPGSALQSEVALRSIVDYARGSLVVRELYHLEPLFQYGINLGLQMVVLRGVRQQAEQLSPSQAAR